MHYVHYSAQENPLMYDIVGLTHDIVYDVKYDIVRTIGKNSSLTYDMTYDVVRCTVSYTIS